MRCSPDIAFPSGEGGRVRLSDSCGRSNVVVILVGGMDDENVLHLLGEEARKYSAIASEEAQVAVVLLKERAGRALSVGRGGWQLVVPIDSHSHAYRLFNALDTGGTVVPAVFVADRFGEIYAEYSSKDPLGLPRIDEALQWLTFISSQCPECGVPEWP